MAATRTAAGIGFAHAAELGMPMDQAAKAISAAPAPLLASCSFCRRSIGEVMHLLVQGAAAICGDCLGEAVAAWKDRVYYAQRKPGAKAATKEPPPPLSAAYTGDCCSGCGNFRVVRTGNCATCLDCGASGGCG
jgi:hypothetical protein